MKLELMKEDTLEVSDDNPLGLPLTTVLFSFNLALVHHYIILKGAIKLLTNANKWVKVIQIFEYPCLLVI